MNDPQAVKISVYGKEFTVKSPADPDITRQYAAYIDKIMKEIGRKTGSLDQNRVATLALLQITHELFMLRSNVTKAENKFEGKMKDLLKAVNVSV